MDEISIKPKLQVLHFIVQNVRMCIHLQYVNKIIPLTQLEIIPGSPAYHAGLLNLAGKSLSVFDLAMRLGLPRNNKYSLDTPILICEADQQRAGMIVDKIIGLTAIDNEMLQMSDDFTKNDSPFTAVVSIDSELALLINMNYVLAISLMNKITSTSLNNDLINRATIKI